ncbi:Retrovirus-related Pol polyprotein from transposon 17.6, partial [Mucuna pruriens]
MSVPKKDRKVQMCVDYRDLTSPDTTKFESPKKIGEKPPSSPCRGTFCYKVMPFRLKNTVATYQRAMVTLFHDMMHKEVEVYVDDMIEKSKMLDQHLGDLRKLFERLRKYRLRLNPVKCTFGVKTRKLLGFIVNQRGIEVDPNKVKDIQNMPPP